MVARPLIKTSLAVLRRQAVLIVSVALLAGTLAVFWPVRHYEFINYDDDRYVSENPHVRQGLTREGVQWALSADLLADSPNADYWIPVTFLSHVLTVQLFGLNPAAHHLVNVGLHGLNTVLLFLLLRRMTGAQWPSAVVAALFAVHPLHVESVAWVTERKDVLSGLFFMLTLLAYARYVESPTAGRYLWIVGAFFLGLLAKPMLITIPFLLLLVDYWPLGRFSLQGGTLRAAWTLVWEKIPLVVLAVGSGLLAYLATQRVGETMVSFQLLPLPARLANALISYAGYMGKLLWPHHLAVFYPYPLAGYPVWQVSGAALLLAGLTVWAIRQRCSQPFLLVGWGWYLGMLVPVIGLVQAGAQAMADRYTYLPLIGLLIAVTWGAAGLTAGWRHRQLLLTIAAVGLIGVCGVLSRQELQHWRTSVELFEHALEVTEKNYIAYDNLGLALAEEGKFREAITYYRKALLIRPDIPAARVNIANALAHEGQYEEAMWYYSQELRVSPNDEILHNNLGMALGNAGKLDEAIDHFTEALRINPDLALAHNNLGLALARQGRYQDAIAHFSRALEIEPNFVDARDNLRTVLSRRRAQGGRE